MSWNQCLRSSLFLSDFICEARAFPIKQTPTYLEDVLICTINCTWYSTVWMIMVPIFTWINAALVCQTTNNSGSSLIITVIAKTQPIHCHYVGNTFTKRWANPNNIHHNQAGNTFMKTYGNRNKHLQEILLTLAQILSHLPDCMPFYWWETLSKALASDRFYFLVFIGQ